MLQDDHATNPADQQFCLSVFAVTAYCLWYCWYCNRRCWPSAFALPFVYCQSLQLHVVVHLPCQAWPAALPHPSCWGCRYWRLGLFFGVRMVPWPPVHRPSSLQAPACEVDCGLVAMVTSLLLRRVLLLSCYFYSICLLFILGYQTKHDLPAGNQFWKSSCQHSIFGCTGNQSVSRNFKPWIYVYEHNLLMYKVLEMFKPLRILGIFICFSTKSFVSCCHSRGKFGNSKSFIFKTKDAMELVTYLNLCCGSTSTSYK